MTSPSQTPPATLPGAAGKRFQLVRYFTLTSLAMFVLVAFVLVHFIGKQGDFYRDVQSREATFFNQVQSTFKKEQDDAARRDLLKIHESGNVNLTRLFANTLWQKDFAPFVERAGKFSADACRSIADEVDPKDGKAKPPAAKKACFAELGNKIAALPGFAELNAKVYDSMKKSTVFKVKVFDLNGITVYSSERAQMGEDKSTNAGWKKALLGTPASELTRRDRFSAFEGVVEKRDLISSYLPVLAPGSDRIVGVFEVYSDVTPFLDQIKATSAHIAKTAADNEALVSNMSQTNQKVVEEIGNTTLIIVLGVMLLLFAALFFIVRRADRMIAEQARERERVQQHLAQSEKLASLGQMVAGIAHQLNTPIAFSHNNVTMAIDALKDLQTPLAVAGRFSSLVKSANSERLTLNVGSKTRAKVDRILETDLDVTAPTEMLADTLNGLDQMRELVENLRDFTRLDRSKTANSDLNKCLHNVVYIARSVVPMHISLVEDYAELPQIECNPSQLNQVFLNLINNAAQAIGTESGAVTVRSRADGDDILVEVADTGPGIPADVLPRIWDTYFTTKKAGEGTGLGLPIAREIVEEHGGRITVSTELGKGTVFSIVLPTAIRAPLAA